MLSQIQILYLCDIRIINVLFYILSLIAVLKNANLLNITRFCFSVSASYCIPQCVRLIAGVCTHYVVYNISKKKNTVDKSKIKDKRKVKPKDKSWVKIGWRTNLMKREDICKYKVEQCW